jgi:hypothetical protein
VGFTKYVRKKKKTCLIDILLDAPPLLYVWIMKGREISDGLDQKD